MCHEHTTCTSATYSKAATAIVARYKRRRISEAARLDPTQTHTIRLRIDREIRVRFNRVKRALRAALDIGLLPISDHVFRDTNERVKPLTVRQFEEWLDKLVQREVVDVVEGEPLNSTAFAWANKYVVGVYRAGVRQANRNARHAGAETPTLEGSLLSVRHLDRAGTAFARIVEKLTSYVAELRTQIAGTVAQGLLEGMGVLEMAQRIESDVDQVGTNNARRLARTELIAAHADASLNQYEELGVRTLTAQVEFTTAQDSRVCPRCAELEGRKYSVKEARGVIPVHPNCRCAWLPVIEVIR